MQKKLFSQGEKSSIDRGDKMVSEHIDYDNLKKRGFSRQKQEGFFVLRTRNHCGVFESGHLQKLIEISQKFARGFMHTTTRQGIEIPFIRFEDIPRVEEELRLSDLETGAAGPRLRTTTCCPGNNWCKSGLVNTFSFCERIEKELHIKCAMDLPHKFKIAISGCPNACTRVQHSDIGVHGAVDSSTRGKRIGYVIYLGGCAGKTPQMAFKLEKVFTEDEALSVIGRVVKFYKDKARPKQRLVYLIEETGRENFLKEAGLDLIPVLN